MIYSFFILVVQSIIAFKIALKWFEVHQNYGKAVLAFGDMSPVEILRNITSE